MTAPATVAQVVESAREVAGDEVARSVFFVTHGTRLAGSAHRYRNRYVLVRVADAFGACAFEEGELDSSVADLSGEPLAALLEHRSQPVRIAAADAALGARAPHRDDPRAELRVLPTGTPDVRAEARDAAVAELLTFPAGARVALIGVVNPLVAAIRERGGEPLLADRNLERTQWDDRVFADHREVIERADAVVATGMTLGNGTFDEILATCRARDIPLAVYAQSGAAVARAFLGSGLSALSAEHFPFSQFSADASPMYLYRGAR
ncbi:Putative heavy-metal chelation domain-containing protein OS=Tsukamurella paurometabola (strain ATCC 8368 / DSM / CCUG 35730 / CIP 100753 / JCM 10117 / KCTC 9821 / NBRC 16120 / NCIMB 702349 / NCTC 13040) OX=521096 GN=Tpau_3723 PE=4 SV=1 [Tsukamurella paurometabola]|uniref:Putative heavy-metal chelation domain-containing protein n=1 Tax=Tsukamurella paurometabola (strain ATCC 8368 / DSM 20162 / CCUG 35730 / CIP 100753 / JCM 10117 / KCTC 9821 / NBRC 16120 / NCIMB 702349 / NCTC 13040) TaxID=521096 RepID=D5UYJ8_TSUPD|nr:DUF364 domain-containing protein [Tsukamurella paurometabola]ADG80301.1 protein of unknown function DUF364 [Tsukamurella paurometabola DSM 20162]SUP39188.1 Domain of uncharacterised function (DUF364) [Tsukamurella paurometabola]